MFSRNNQAKLGKGCSKAGFIARDQTSGRLGVGANNKVGENPTRMGLLRPTPAYSVRTKREGSIEPRTSRYIPIDRYARVVQKPVKIAHSPSGIR
jgi:hypothetical protein